MRVHSNGRFNFSLIGGWWSFVSLSLSLSLSVCVCVGCTCLPLCVCVRVCDIVRRVLKNTTSLQIEGTVEGCSWPQELGLGLVFGFRVRF